MFIIKSAFVGKRGILHEVCYLGSIPLIIRTFDVCICCLLCFGEMLTHFHGSYSATENDGIKKNVIVNCREQ